ncbi:hypothetical protein ABIB30_004431 [Pedobacter sp. UYP1]
MESLPLEFKILRRIKMKLDKLMSDRGTPVEIRSNFLYDYIIKDEDLKKVFTSQMMFNQFLRAQHNGGNLKQIIPNYKVDTSNHIHYQWHFYKDTNINIGQGKGIEAVGSQLTYKDNELIVPASDGTLLRTHQERGIYEKLLKCNYLTIEYEFPVSKYGHKKYADFRILNRMTQKIYFWEHFGMTNSDDYMEEVAKKLLWYKNNGFKTVENGGNLIYTIYSDENKLQRDTDNYINIIIK